MTDCQEKSKDVHFGGHRVSIERSHGRGSPGVADASVPLVGKVSFVTSYPRSPRSSYAPQRQDPAASGNLLPVSTTVAPVSHRRQDRFLKSQHLISPLVRTQKGDSLVPLGTADA